MRIGSEAMPLHEEIKGRQHKSELCLECLPGPMGHLFHMTHATHHGQHGFNQHPRIPRSPVTELEIRRLTFFGMEGSITPDDPSFRSKISLIQSIIVTLCSPVIEKRLARARNVGTKRWI